MIVGSIKLNWK